MDNQDRFREALEELLLLGNASGLSLTKEQIRQQFSDFALDEEKEKLIFAYLEMNRIRVEEHARDEETMSWLQSGEEKEPEKKLTGEESKVYQMYLEEIKSIAPLGKKECEGLLARVKMGDSAAVSRLTEGYLSRVVELAREYAGQGVLLGDLVQEGNVALFLAVSSYEEGDFGVHLTREIISAMDAAIAEQTGENDTGSYLAAKTNAMMKATEELVNELGREATLEEVAAKMKLSPEMTRDLMKISMDALSVVEGSGETYGSDN